MIAELQHDPLTVLLWLIVLAVLFALVMAIIRRL